MNLRSVYCDDRLPPYIHLDLHGYRTAVADKNTDKKQKTQKVKSKALTVEAKKHLASVRVIQRNLVYIIGLPANLCNESVRTIFFTYPIFSYGTSRFCRVAVNFSAHVNVIMFLCFRYLSAGNTLVSMGRF
jgi:hypothetical protein